MIRSPPDFSLHCGDLRKSLDMILSLGQKNRNILPPRVVLRSEMKRSLSPQLTICRKLMEAIVSKAEDDYSDQ